MIPSDPHSRIAVLERELAWPHLKIQSLTEELRQQRVKLLGPRSETLSDLQLQLLADEEPGTTLDEVEAEARRTPLPVVPPRQRRPHPGRQRLPENLPRVEEVVRCAEQTCRQCGAATAVIGYDESEQVDVQPARYFVRVTKREKRACRCCQGGTVTMPPLAPRIVEKGLASDRVVVETVVSKYADHLPLYRQEQIFKQRHGVELSRQTLMGWIDLVADWLQSIYGHLRSGVFSCGYVQIDETPVRYLAPGHGKTKQGYFWAANRPGGEVIYHWETSRAARCLETVVPVDFKGTVQCDGYSGYDTFARQREGDVTLADCWAHVRRKFFDAKESTPRTAGWFLRQIQHLYRIEARLREKRYSPKLRAVIRMQESRPIVERIGQACIRLKQGNRHLPQSPLGLALNYTLNQWAGLQVFLTEGRVEIDNNLVENAIRPTAVGKKNWLFIGEAEAGQRSAILFTVIENCRRLKINPFDYLRDILTRLPKLTNHQTHTLTPAAWAKEQAQLQHSSLKLAS
jgi:transposase